MSALTHMLLMHQCLPHVTNAGAVILLLLALVSAYVVFVNC